jgi:hypothetical protein
MHGQVEGGRNGLPLDCHAIGDQVSDSPLRAARSTERSATARISVKRR